jgi:hypothetical protein
MKTGHCAVTAERSAKPSFASLDQDGNYEEDRYHYLNPWKYRS